MVTGLAAKRIREPIVALLAAAYLLLLPGFATGQASTDSKPPLTVAATGFLLRGKPFRIVSGELEYARIPRPYWRDRLRKAHAMGLNAVTVYVFWNVHEETPGVFDFSGQKDVAEFLREAQQEGLYVILRPGPYVCAEWDLGGYPAWLLKDHAMELRSLQPMFKVAATRWMLRLGQELAPLQASRGGPILAVQVENEYGSFGEDRDYMKWMHETVIRAGFGGSLLYTGDGADVLQNGSLPGLLAAIDFGTGDA
jgi:beta-galactosidase